MTLETLAPITIKLDGEVVRFPAGAIFTVTENQAARLLDRAPGKLRPITLPPSPVDHDGPQAPLQPGWLIAFRDHQGRLRGGCDERDAGTVQKCRWDGRAWTVSLTNGETLPLSLVRAVGQTNEAGQIVAAWCVREHGFDGGGRT